MSLWWESLTMVEQIFAYIAIPATMILILQTLLLLFGLGDHDADTDHDISFDHDGTPDGMSFDGHIPNDGIFGDDHPDAVFHGDSGLRLFTLRGIIAFFAVAGWTGLALLRGNMTATPAVLLAFLAGTLAMILVAMALRWFYKSQNNGNMDLHNALGLSGTVYITVPPSRLEQGKVNIMLQGQYTELSAVTDDETPIATGTEITVVGISGVNTLVVKRK